MFLVEGLLAVIVGIWAYWYLDNKPENASWLNSQEKQELKKLLEEEASAKNEFSPKSVWRTFIDRKVLLLCVIYFLIQICMYGVVYYLPTQVSGLIGKKVGLLVGLITTIPWLCALTGAYFIPKLSDRTGKRRTIAVIALVAGAIGIAGSTAAGTPVVALVSLCLAMTGIISVQPVFWTFPTGYLSGTAAAGGIALINSLGNLGGFVAPNIKTWAEKEFSSASAGLFVLASSAVLCAVLIYLSVNFFTNHYRQKRN